MAGSLSLLLTLSCYYCIVAWATLTPSNGTRRTARAAGDENRVFYIDIIDDPTAEPGQTDSGLSTSSDATVEVDTLSDDELTASERRRQLELAVRQRKRPRARPPYGEISVVTQGTVVRPRRPTSAETINKPNGVDGYGSNIAYEIDRALNERNDDESFMPATNATAEALCGNPFDCNRVERAWYRGVNCNAFYKEKLRRGQAGNYRDVLSPPYGVFSACEVLPRGFSDGSDTFISIIVLVVLSLACMNAYYTLVHVLTMDSVRFRKHWNKRSAMFGMMNRGAF